MNFIDGRLGVEFQVLKILSLPMSVFIDECGDRKMCCCGSKKSMITENNGKKLSILLTMLITMIVMLSIEHSIYTYRKTLWLCISSTTVFFVFFYFDIELYSVLRKQIAIYLRGITNCRYF